MAFFPCVSYPEGDTDRLFPPFFVTLPFQLPFFTPLSPDQLLTCLFSLFSLPQFPHEPFLPCVFISEGDFDTLNPSFLTLQTSHLYLPRPSVDIETLKSSLLRRFGLPFLPLYAFRRCRNTSFFPACVSLSHVTQPPPLALHVLLNVFLRPSPSSCLGYALQLPSPASLRPLCLPSSYLFFSPPYTSAMSFSILPLSLYIPKRCYPSSSFLFSPLYIDSVL